MGLFALKENKKDMRITFPSSLDAKTSQQFESESKAWMMKPVDLYIFDFKDVSQITREFYAAVIAFQNTLKKDKKIICTLNMKPELTKQVTSDGLSQVFNPMHELPSLDHADAPGKGKHVPGLDVGFLNSFLVATQRTLQEQCNTEVTAGKPFMKKEVNKDIAILGVLNLASTGFHGSIVLCFPKATFLKVYQNMFDEKHEEITQEIQDAVGELLNIIYGIAKIDLNNKGYSFQKALPTVLAADKISVRQTGPFPPMVIPFTGAAGPFQVEIEFNEDKE